MWLVQILIFLLRYGQTLTSSMEYNTQNNYFSAGFHKLSQMTNYFVMRGCEHIGDTSIWSQEGIHIFKYPKGFWRSLSEISQFYCTLSI